MTLKRQLDEPGSPMRVFLDERLPNVAAVRRQYNAQLAGAGRVGAEEAFAAAGATRFPATEVGHGFSALLTLLFAGADEVYSAAPSRHPLTGKPWPAAQVFKQALVGEATGLVAASASDPAARDRLVRLALTEGFFDQITRAPCDGSMPMLRLSPDASVEDLLGCHSELAVRDLTLLLVAARRELAALLDSDDPRVLTPVFSGSGLVGGADGDLIVGGLLIEAKARKKPDLEKRHLQQLVSYALLDLEDEYQLTYVGMYVARSGRLVTWALPELLATLAGADVEPAELRAQLAAHLGR